MKILAAFVSLILVAQAQAYQVVGAKLDQAKKNILVDVRYGGGCEEHEFELILQGCLESYPVQCKATLAGMTRSGNPDFCEAMITKKVSFSLKEYELDDGYYSRGTLTIYGDIGPSGKPSTATVRLPEVK